MLTKPNFLPRDVSVINCFFCIFFYHFTLKFTFFEPAVFNVLWKSYQKISWGYLQYISFHLKNNIFVFFQMPELCTTVFVIFYHFLSIYPLNNPENLNFEKNEKNMPGDIIILHICTLNESHMMYGSRDTECDRQNFLSLWAIFCPFTPLTTRKI